MIDPLDESTVLCIKPQILKMVFKAGHNLAVSWSPQRPCHPPHLFASPMFWLTRTEILTVTQMGYLGLPLCCSLRKKISHEQEHHYCEPLLFSRVAGHEKAGQRF